MTIYRDWTGPQLRDFINVRMHRAGINGYVSYAYVQPSNIHRPGNQFEHFIRSPEYWAEYIKISAYYINMAHPLDPLFELLSEIPGMRMIRKITEHETLRPQVQAIIKRRVAER